MKDGNLDKEMDIGCLYINKQGRTEFILSHGNVSFEEIVENLKKSTF